VIRRCLLSILLLQLGCAVAFAVSLPQVGQRASGTIDLLGKLVPLPPGEWQVAAAGFGAIADQDPGPYGAIGGVLLLRPGDDHDEFLLVHTNVLPVQAGWGEPPECVADHVLFQSVGEPRNLHNACAFVVALRRGQLIRSRLPAFGNAETAARLATSLPPWALVTGFRVSDRRDMLDIRYGVSPHKPDAAAWFTPGAELDHAHRATLQELSGWAQTARKTAIAALRDPIEQVPAMPALVLTATPGGGEVPQEQISALRLGLYKLATYRVPATLFTLAVSSIAAGDIYIGGIITFWQSLTHSGVYLGNELAWEWPSPTPMMPLVATQPGPASDAAEYDGRSAYGDAAIQVAANSNQLPESALAARGFFAVDGKQVPLPAGNWTVLATATDADVTSTMLSQSDAGALRGLVVIHDNAAKTAAILGPSAECKRGDIAFAVTRYDTPEDGFCAYGKRVAPALAGEDNALWARARARLSELGIVVPPLLAMVGARARTQGNFLDARYYFAPPDGREPAASPELSTALQNWADLVQEPLELGVRGRLAPQEFLTPWPWEGDAVRSAIKLQTAGPLEALAAAGTIGPTVLQHQLAQADAAAANREQQRLSLWSRSFFKVATYRVSAYIDTFAVQTFFTASPAQGVAVASVHAVAKPIMAYGNELYWAHSGVGKAPATLLSASFPEIGAER
jgi:uncharacterized membrane protein